MSRPYQNEEGEWIWPDDAPYEGPLSRPFSPDESLIAGCHMEDANWVKEALAKGANPNTRDWVGKTPLDLASTKEIQQILEAHGAKRTSWFNRFWYGVRR